MVVLIDGVDLRVGADFREFFLLFFLLLFLLAGIGALETSIVNFVDLRHGFHHALGAGGSARRGVTFGMDTPGRRKSYQAEPDGARVLWCYGQSQNPHPVASRDKDGAPSGIFRLTVLGSVSKS